MIRVKLKSEHHMRHIDDVAHMRASEENLRGKLCRHCLHPWMCWQVSTLRTNTPSSDRKRKLFLCRGAIFPFSRFYCCLIRYIETWRNNASDTYLSRPLISCSRQLFPILTSDKIHSKPFSFLSF